MFLVYINGYFFDRLFKKPPCAGAYISSGVGMMNSLGVKEHSGNDVISSLDQEGKSDLLHDVTKSDDEPSEEPSHRTRVASLPPILEYKESI